MIHKKIIYPMMKIFYYESPKIQVVEIAVEEGFLLSGDGSSSDYGDGGEGTEME